MSSFFHRAFARASRLLPIRALRACVRELLRELDRRGDHWLTTHQRPKATAGIQRALMGLPDDQPTPTFAIVMQGPLVTTDDFTAQTVELYRRLFHSAQIIVSTWAGSDAGQLARIRAAGADVVLSDPPGVPGILNVNYQIISTRAGIEHAAAGGAEFVLKTRADQRVYAPGLDAALLTLLTAFPLSTNDRARHRIAALSNDSRLFIPYHLADQLQCGHVADMLKFWSAPLDTRPREIDWTKSIRELVTARSMAEVYLTTHYLEQLGVPTPCRLESWWDALADYFCVIDSASLDWYWPKHDQQAEYRYRSYSSVINAELLNFAGWLQLAGGYRPLLRNPDNALDLRISASIPSDWFEILTPGKPAVGNELVAAERGR